MNKRIAAVAAAVFCLALGAVRAVDLVRWTETSTGFPLVGEAWYRYLAALVGAVVLYLLSRCAQPRPAAMVRGKAWLGIGMLLAGGLMLETGVSTILVRSGALVMPRGILEAVSGGWMILFGLQAFLAPPKKPLPAVLGLPMLAGPLWLTVERFAMEPASVTRTTHIFAVLSAVAALCAVNALLKVIILPTAAFGKGLFFYGMLAFLFCTCGELPQTVLAFVGGTADLLELVESCGLGAVGLCGLICAVYATGPQRSPVPGERTGETD